MKSPCDNLHPFADGQLDEAAHRRFESHLASCDQCGRGLEEIMQLGALADQVLQDETRREQRMNAVSTAGVVMASKLSWWKRHWRWHAMFTPRGAMAGFALCAAVALFFFLFRGPQDRSPDAILIAELQARPYRATEARLATAAFSAYRPLSGERGQEQRLVDAVTTMRQQGLAELEQQKRHHLLGVVYLLGQQYGRAERALSVAPDGPEVSNDRAVLALAQGNMQAALEWSDRALSVAPGLGASLWNRALALEGLGRIAEAARAFEASAARNEIGWSAEATLRASVLRAKLAPREAPIGPR